MKVRFYARLINTITWLFIGISLILTALFTIRRFLATCLRGAFGLYGPVYPVGSLIYVAPVDVNSLEPGDAITFDRNDAVVTHQVYEVNADSKTVMTQGVANVDSDGPSCTTSSLSRFPKFWELPFSVFHI